MAIYINKRKTHVIHEDLPEDCDSTDDEEQLDEYIRTEMEAIKEKYTSKGRTPTWLQ